MNAPRELIYESHTTEFGGSPLRVNLGSGKGFGLVVMTLNLVLDSLTMRWLFENQASMMLMSSRIHQTQAGL